MLMSQTENLGIDFLISDLSEGIHPLSVIEEHCKAVLANVITTGHLLTNRFILSQGMTHGLRPFWLFQAIISPFPFFKEKHRDLLSFFYYTTVHITYDYT